VDETGRQIADRAQPEGLEMAECLGRRRNGPPRRSRVARWNIGPHDRRTSGVDTRPEAFVDELERWLDARPARGDPAEDLGHRLDGLDVGRDR
jgi:hypothetical protein